MAAKAKEFGRKIWFKSRRYGWGFAPATWQAWLIMAIWLMLVVVYVVNIDNASESIAQTLLSVLPFVVLMVVILVMISYRRGENPKLQWRRRKKTKKSR